MAHQAQLAAVTQQAADSSRAAADSANSAAEEISRRAMPALPDSATTELVQSDPTSTTQPLKEQLSLEQTPPVHLPADPHLPGGEEITEGMPDASTLPTPEVPLEGSITGPGAEDPAAGVTADPGAVSEEKPGSAQPEAAAHVVPSVELGATAEMDIPSGHAQEIDALPAGEAEGIDVPAGGLLILIVIFLFSVGLP